MSEFFLYAAELKDGTVKIGVTGSPQSRMWDLQAKMKQRVTRLATAPCSGPDKFAHERRALQMAQRVSNLHRAWREVFESLPFGQAAHFVRQAAGRTTPPKPKRKVKRAAKAAQP